MKAIILAAGKGSRLGKRTGPKPLTVLENGKSILGMQLDTIAPYIPINDTYIVVGYYKEMIINLFPDAHYVFNPDYAHENTSKSLLKALQHVDDDILWLNGDVVFHPSALEKVLESPTSCMLVNNAPVGEEEVKYCTDGHQRILEVSKQVQQPEGEALGINLFKKKDLAVLKKELAACKLNDYFEKAVEEAIRKGVEIRAVPFDKDRCVEVDFSEDIARANVLIKQW